MSKIRIALTLAFLFPILATNVAAQKSRAPARDYFPLRVGDSWTYRNSEGDSEFTVKVLSAEKQGDDTMRYLVEKHAGAQIHSWYSKLDGWVLMLEEAYVGQEGMKIKYEPARQYLKNPLVVNTKWSWKGKGIVGVDVAESHQVVGAEMVKVPAGRFRAMKIVSKVSDGGAAMTKTFWYADGVGLIKSQTEAGAIKYGSELVDYSFKKKSPKK